MSFTLGIDASRWDLPLDWSKIKAGGAAFAILKASQGRSLRDPRFEQHLQGALGAGMIVGAYHWCDPNQHDKKQAANFLDAIAGKDISFAAVDVEQHWQDWLEWERRCVSKIVSPERISQCALGTAREIKAASGLPTLIYTRASFVREYAAPMLAWLPEWDLWLAHYPYGSARVSCGWEQLPACFPQAKSPALPPGCSDWRFWQFSADKFNLPGARSPLDLDFFNGNLEDLQAWCRLEIVKQPPTGLDIEPGEMLARLWAAHPEIHTQTEVLKHG
jgi:lysozyme